jgi:hypothetical protein
MPRKSKKPPRQKRPWPVTAAGLLLLIQSFGLYWLAFYNYPVDREWRITRIGDIFLLLFDLLPVFIYGLLCIFALLSCIYFLRVARNAWFIAVAVQGLSLLGALVQYVRSRPPYVFLLMAYCIFMVIYLHYYEVQEPFERKKIDTEIAGMGRNA